MAWTETDRVQIRDMLGFGAIFLQADPRLETAITAVQAVADGGTRPDTSTELFIRTLIADFQLVLTSLKALWNKAIAVQVDEVKVDVYRGRQMLCQDGRRIVNRLSAVLSTHPRRDVFGTPKMNPRVDAFDDVYLGNAGYHW